MVGVCLLSLSLSLLFLPPPGAIATASEEEPYVLTTVPVGVGPWAVAVNPDTNRLYVGNYFRRTVSVIETLSHEVVATHYVSRPASIRIDGETEQVYVGAEGGVVVIDGYTDQVLSRITLGPSRSSVIDLEINPEVQRVYALLDGAYGACDSVFAIDTGTHGIARELGTASQLGDLAIDHPTDDLLLVDSAASSICVVDCGCQGVEESIPIGIQGSDSALDRRTGRLYVPGSGKVAVFDPATRELVDTLDLSGPVAVDPVRSRLYVLGSTGMTVVDTRSHEILAEVPIRPFAAGLVVNPLNGRVYVASRRSDRITVIDGVTLQVVTELTKERHLGYPPTILMALDAWTERVYVPNFERGSVTVVQDVTGRVLPPAAEMENP
jgi:YVTN family beta-propeller protein